MVTGLLGSFVQIPMMSLYGVLTSMTIDYNEWKYDKKLVAMSGGAIGFGSKVGNGLGVAVLSALWQSVHMMPRWKSQVHP